MPEDSEEEMLLEFWAVTHSRSKNSTALYQIGKFSDGAPMIVVKMDGKGESSIPVLARLQGGNRIIISSYISLIDITSMQSGQHTASLVGLFLSEDVAKACFNTDALQAHDPRWVDNSKEVLEAIGRGNIYIGIERDRLPQEWL